MVTCQIEGCENLGQKSSRNGRRYLKRGMCHKHYEKWRRRGDALAPDSRTGHRKVNGPTKVCKGCKVEKDTEADFYKNKHGWVYTYCKKCHNKKTKAVYLRHRLDKGPRVKIDRGECAFDGCAGKAKTRLVNGPEGWYCGAHYNQWWNKKELHPLRRHVINAYKDDEFRQCTVCFNIKSLEDYHFRVNGDRQSVCKTCATQQARFHILRRAGRLDEALEKAQAMAESVREKYVDMVTDAIKEREFERSNQKA